LKEIEHLPERPCRKQGGRSPSEKDGIDCGKALKIWKSRLPFLFDTCKEGADRRFTVKGNGVKVTVMTLLKTIGKVNIDPERVGPSEQHKYKKERIALLSRVTLQGKS